MTVLDEVAAERKRQDEIWGPQDHLDGVSRERFAAALEYARRSYEKTEGTGQTTWVQILDEELYEAYVEDSDEDALRTELIQVAAVAVAWAEAIDRRRANADVRV